MTDFPPFPALGFVRPGFGDLPVGSVVPFAGTLGPADAPLPVSPPAPTSPPTTWPIEAWGWMLCDGRRLPIAGYGELFATLGFLHGGNGQDQFQIPDYRGYFLRGVDGGAGRDPDIDDRVAPPGGVQAGVGSTQASALQTHVHNYVEITESPPGGDGASVGMAGPQAPTSPPQQTSGAPALVISQAESRPVNIYVNFIIKFTSGLRPTFDAP